MLTEPVALAPEAGREQAVGEVSGRGRGVRDPRRDAALGGARALPAARPGPARPGAGGERVGAGRCARSRGSAPRSRASGPARPTSASTACAGIWGPSRENVLARAARAIGRPARVAGAPTRFCAFAAASRCARGRRPPGRRRVVGAGREREFLAPLPVGLLDGRLRGDRGRRAGGRLVATLERLGVGTLGELAALPRVAVADRFGAARAARRAGSPRGIDEPLRPRLPHEELIQAIGLPEAAYGTQLERALELLIERLLADPRRRGRAIRSLRLEARLAGGGSWSADAVMRSASGSPERLRLALGAEARRLLAAPATSLALRALELAPGGGVQPALDPDPAERRRERLAEAVRQVRAAAGRDSVLRVLEVDPGSRVPERWAALAPLNEAGGDPRGPPREQPLRAAAGRRSAAGDGGRRESVGGRRGRGGPRGVAGRGPLVDAASRCAATTSSWSSRTAAARSSSATCEARPLVRQQGDDMTTSSSTPTPSFSFLDGASNPDELALRAAELGHEALALTDHDGLWGSMEFAQACRIQGIRPITGTELTVLDAGSPPPPPGFRGNCPPGAFHLTLLVESAGGYRNLCRLLTRAHAADPRRSRRPGPAVRPAGRAERHAEGLVCLSGCARDGALAGRIARGDRAGAERLGRRLRGGVRPRPLPGRAPAAVLARRPGPQPRGWASSPATLGVPCVATGNVHAHDRSRVPLQDALVAVRLLRHARVDRAASGAATATSTLVEPGAGGGALPRAPRARSPRPRGSPSGSRFDLTRDLGYSYPGSEDGTADRRLAETCRARFGERYDGTPERREAERRLERGAAGDRRPRALRLLPAPPRPARARPRGRGRGPRARQRPGAAAAGPRARARASARSSAT